MRLKLTFSGTEGLKLVFSDIILFSGSVFQRAGCPNSEGYPLIAITGPVLWGTTHPDH